MNTKNDLKKAIQLLLGILFGYIMFVLTSHPQSVVHQKLPKKKYKRFHYFPHIKVEHKKHIFHFHHWFNFSIFYLFLIFSQRNLLKYKFAHGFFIGTIVQGLVYKDRFRFIYPVNG